MNFGFLVIEGKTGKTQEKMLKQFPSKKTFVECMMGKKSVTQAIFFKKTEKNAI